MVIEGEKIISREKWGAWEWEHYVNLPRNPVYVVSGLTIIDENVYPRRVVKISYGVHVKIVDDNRYLTDYRRSFSKREEVVGDIQWIITHTLEGFNAEPTVDFSRFLHAKLRKSADFDTTMKAALNPKLAPLGLEVVGTWYTIE